MKAAALMLETIHSQESKVAAREKAIQVSEKLKVMKQGKAAQKVEDSIEETLTYMNFPYNTGLGSRQTIPLSVSTVRSNAGQK